MNSYFKLAALATILLVGVASIIATSGGPEPEPEPEPEPKFISFSVGPSVVCLNTTADFIRVEYEVDLDGWSPPETLCVDIRANGQPAHPEIHHQCMDVGTSGELTFRPTELFGTDVPSSITVTGELVPSVAGESKDTRSSTVTTQADCPPPGTVPSP